MQKLTKAEEEVMQIIWKMERCTVSQILDYIENDLQQDRPPHSSISSIVRIVEEKGFLDHKAYGRTYEYFPIISKEDYSKRTLKKVIQDYFNGSVQNMVSFLVKENDLSVSELNEMLDKLDETESKNA
ncbi:MAG: BlaI/MecI/CopY family transcriptional regulator [Saprospiraceae bacterium]|nr:BlaI/MecI/CopY family transcriptional regulator [Saprospiraceae bacterium]